MTTVDPAVGEYLAGLRSALADLPAAEVDEIVDDAGGHLAELAAEMGPDAGRTALEARLGTPAAYAAELRAAAGYPAPPPATAPQRGRARGALALLMAAVLATALAGLVRNVPFLLFALVLAAVGLALVAGDGPGVPSVADLPVVRRLRTDRPASGPARAFLDFAASLEPAWWLARAVAAGVVAAFPLGLDGAAIAVLVLVAVPVSVWIGYRSRADRRWWWVVAPLNTLAAVVLLYGLASAAMPPASVTYTGLPGLAQDNVPVRDVRPFDSFGNPLSNVYLFDQDGRPLDTDPVNECTPPTSAQAYPRGEARFDPDNGACTRVPPGPLAVAIPTPAPTATSASPTPVAPTSPPR